jgi:hypothetical protein
VTNYSASGHHRGPIAGFEAVLLGVMAAVVVAISIPQYASWQRHRHDAAARATVTRAAEAAESFGADRGSFAGVTAAALSRYDDTLADAHVRIVASAALYCVESTVGGRTWHLARPAGDVARGAC